MALAVVIALSAFAPMPAYAASKKVAVEIKSPKAGVKLSGTKLAVHVKHTVPLRVRRDAAGDRGKILQGMPGVLCVRLPWPLPVEADGAL